MNVLRKILRVLRIAPYRSALLRTGVFASTEHDAVLAGLALETVVDIGANRGQFALCIRRLYPAARIYSFEPLQAPALKYRRNFEHDTCATLFNFAIGEESSRAAMNVSRWDVSSSLLPFARAQHDNFPFSQVSRQETVSMARLSDCLEASAIRGTALLKLDVQGYELIALRGCGALLEEFSYVYVEASFIELYVGQALAADIIALLMSRGFRLLCVANPSYGNSPRPIQADFLFARH